MLVEAPLGIAWTTLPFSGASKAQQLNTQMDICWAATHEADGIVNQVLRATQDTEEFHAPDPGGANRCRVEKSGVARVLCSRWPILAVLGGQVAPAASFPPAFRAIPADQMRPGGTLLPVAGSSVGIADGPQELYIAPGYVSASPRSHLLQVSYVNGWPHTGVTATAADGATTLEVDDVTGWAVGGNTIGQLYDGAQTEVVTVTSVSGGATSGPGTLQLASPLAFDHTISASSPVEPLLLTTMPSSIRWAVSLLAAAQALTRGAMAITVQELSGRESGGGSGGAEQLKIDAEVILHPYSRVV